MRKEVRVKKRMFQLELIEADGLKLLIQTITPLTTTTPTTTRNRCKDRRLFTLEILVSSWMSRKKET